MNPSTRPATPAPLTDPDAVRAHLDGLLGPADRERHTAGAVLCDAAAHPLINSVVNSYAPEPTVAECARIADVFALAQVRADANGTMLLAITRPGGAAAEEVDERWFHGLNRACAHHDVRPLGLYIATTAATFAFTLDDLL